MKVKKIAYSTLLSSSYKKSMQLLLSFGDWCFGYIWENDQFWLQVYCLGASGRETALSSTNIHMVLGFSPKMFQVQDSNQNHLQDRGKL